MISIVIVMHADRSGRRVLPVIRPGNHFDTYMYITTPSPTSGTPSHAPSSSRSLPSREQFPDIEIPT